MGEESKIFGVGKKELDAIIKEEECECAKLQ